MKKSREVEEVRDLIEQHRVVAIAGLHKIRAAQLQELKKKLVEVYMRVVKNSIMERTIGSCEGKANLDKLRDFLGGSNIFLFADINPFKLALLLDKSKVEMFAKAGDIASRDIVVPAGNTGLAPGPIISQLNTVGLPTRIETGSVWISRDTLVVREGEVISERLTAVLSKLGIKSVKAGLSLKVVYDDGSVITEDQLHIDLEEVKRKIEQAYLDALSLSVSAAYPTEENIPMLIQNAHREAYNLAMKASIVSPEIIADLIRKAHSEASILISRIKLD
ncbi:MAG: 50S ribosomal protein L10 [Candidatus Bathyarchaeota archaeon]|nr:50S ribosomal protein L10 [Candidatus Bathyarchaeota archaeon]MDH5686878.1 50S ribosomal protein L10 [Candidatus Bathyarchaeota archaeon]